jgi:hypothetical protein
MTKALRNFRRKALLPLCQRVDEGGRILGRAVKLEDRTRLAGLADPVESASERLKVERLRTDFDGNFQFAKRGFESAVEIEIGSSLGSLRSCTRLRPFGWCSGADDLIAGRTKGWYHFSLVSAIVATSVVNHRRIRRARVWLESRVLADEVLIIGASLDAANELSRRVAQEKGAAFGWHRLTLPQLAAAIAAPVLAERKLVPSTSTAAFTTERVFFADSILWSSWFTRLF